MIKIEWSEEFEIGIHVIDVQHRRIVDYINQLHDVVRREADRSIIGEVIDNLVDYTNSHFAFEEALMEEVGYDALCLHQSTHNAFTNRIETMKARFNNHEDIAAELAELLQGWLIKHIKHDDASYADLVKAEFLSKAQEQQQSWVKRAIASLKMVS